jgi:hypothetical protein
VWGIHSVVVENEITDEASMTKLACDAALAGDFGKPGDNIVIVAGIPFGASGTTNLLRIGPSEGLALIALSLKTDRALMSAVSSCNISN